MISPGLSRVLGWCLATLCLPAVSGGASSTGDLAGALGYPGEAIPPMRVCALSLGDPANTRCLSTKWNQKAYRISGLKPGNYHVVAYPGPEAGTAIAAGAYTRMVPCGLKKECTDHTLMPVAVGQGVLIRGIDPVDFYAPAGAFPRQPP